VEAAAVGLWPRTRSRVKPTELRKCSNKNQNLSYKQGPLLMIVYTTLSVARLAKGKSCVVIRVSLQQK